MATVTGYTAARMKQIEDETVVNGHVDPSHHLILTTREGTEIDAGDISAVPRVSVEDTSSVDLTLTGNGSDSTPWKIKADVKEIPATKVTSGVFDLARIPDMSFSGILDGAYRGSGPAKVYMDSTPTPVTLTNVGWAVTYLPYASRRVSLMKMGGNWVITGQMGNEVVASGGHKTVKLTMNQSALNTGWVTYGGQFGEACWADGPFATQLPSGLVVLSGLIRFNQGTPANGSTILSGLPPEMRPAKQLIHYVNNGDTSKYVWITPTGDMLVGESFLSNGYLSLDGVAFWPAGVGTWTDIGNGGSSFGANFEARVDSGWETPSYWKDPYGYVWFRGVLRVKVATSADNTVMVNLPVDHRASPTVGSIRGGYRYLKTVANGGYGGIGVNATLTGTDGLHWKPNTPGSVGVWISLNGVVYPTIDAMDNPQNIWETIYGWNNAWVDYHVTHPTPAFSRRPDGLVIGQGMIGSGTVGGSSNRAFTLQSPEFWPNHGRPIIDTIANNARARLDIGHFREQDAGKYPGSVSVVNGSNAWLSLDGVKYVPGP